MIAPTVQESLERILERGIDVARTILDERGIEFRDAESVTEANEILEYEVDRLYAERDLEGAAAALLQTHQFVDSERARNFSDVLCQFGDNSFWDDDDSDSALQMFQLAAALAPNNLAAVKGVITVCLQGEDRRPSIALPYMVVRAHLGDGNEVGYVLNLIEKEESYFDRVNVGPKSGPRAGEPWFENAGANPQRNGQARVAIAPPLQLAWTAEPGVIVSAVLISGSVVVVGTKWPGELHAFDLHTGKQLWKYALNEMLAGTAAIEGGRLFAGKPGDAFCLDVNTGDLLWKSSAMRDDQVIPGSLSMTGCVLAVGGKAIVSNDGFTVYESESGHIHVRHYDAFEADYNTGPCSDGRYCYIPALSSIIRLDLKSREQRSIRIDSKIKSGPIIAGDKLVYGNNRSTVSAHSLPDLKQAWSFAMEDPPEDSTGFIESRPAFAQERVFFAGTDGNVYALNATNGKKIWKSHLGGAIQGSPVISGETLYIMAPRGFCALSLAKGDLLWEQKARGFDTPAAPALAEDYVVIGYEKLFAFKGKKVDALQPKTGSGDKPWWKLW